MYMQGQKENWWGWRADSKGCSVAYQTGGVRDVRGQSKGVSLIFTGQLKNFVFILKARKPLECLSKGCQDQNCVWKEVFSLQYGEWTGGINGGWSNRKLFPLSRQVGRVTAETWRRWADLGDVKHLKSTGLVTDSRGGEDQMSDMTPAGWSM